MQRSIQLRSLLCVIALVIPLVFGNLTAAAMSPEGVAEPSGQMESSALFTTPILSIAFDGLAILTSTENFAIIFFITLMALTLPFVFAWAGNIRAWAGGSESIRLNEEQKERTLVFLGVIFVVGLLIQTFHMAEHVAQVIQKFPLQQEEAHGLLGAQFDREWVHWIYNVAYFLFVAVLLVGYRAVYKGAERSAQSLFFTMLWFVFILQGYHFAEHSLKVIQYFQSGIQDTPGFAGGFFPLIWVHFLYNLLVYLPLVLAFFGGGVCRTLFKSMSKGRAAVADS